MNITGRRSGFRLTSTAMLAGCSIFLLSLAGAPMTVRGDVVSDIEVQHTGTAEYIVPATHDNKAAEIASLLDEKIAALSTAETTILSLQDQLKASSQELGSKAESLTASEQEVHKLSEQVKELTAKVEASSSAAATELEHAKAEAITASMEVSRLNEQVKSLEAAVGEEKEKGAVALNSVKEESAAALAAEKEKGAVALNSVKEESAAALEAEKEKAALALAAEKEAAAASVSKAQEEAAVSAERVKVLEAEVAKAGSDALTARKTWEEELKVKDKEVVETKAKLRHAVDTKYSFRVLSADFSAWSKNMGAAMKFW